MDIGSSIFRREIILQLLYSRTTATAAGIATGIASMVAKAGHDHILLHIPQVDSDGHRACLGNITVHQSSIAPGTFTCIEQG